MSQQTVITFLGENKKKWFTTRQIAEGLNASVGSITCNVKKLRESESIDWRIERDRGHWKTYIYKYRN